MTKTVAICIQGREKLGGKPLYILVEYEGE